MQVRRGSMSAACSCSMAEERKNAHVKTRASKTCHCPRPWPAWAGHCQLWPFMAAYGNVNPPSQNYSEKADSRYHLSPVTGPCYFHWATSSRYARGNGHGRCFCCCCFFCQQTSDQQTFGQQTSCQQTSCCIRPTSK